MGCCFPPGNSFCATAHLVGKVEGKPHYRPYLPEIRAFADAFGAKERILVVKRLARGARCAAGRYGALVKVPVALPILVFVVPVNVPPVADV